MGRTPAIVQRRALSLRKHRLNRGDKSRARIVAFPLPVLLPSSPFCGALLQTKRREFRMSQKPLLGVWAMCVFSAFAAASASAQTSTPYGGVPAPLPGTLHLENFDNGGPNVAYVDAT